MGKETNTTKLKMQRENGVKENGKMSHRTSGLPVRNDITREQCLSLIDSCERLTGWKVTKAYLEHKRTHEVLPPMTNVEKLEKEGEEVGIGQGVTATQSSVAPVSSTTANQVQAPTVVLAEEPTARASAVSAPLVSGTEAKKETSSLLRRIHDFWTDDSSFHKETEVKKVKTPYDMSHVDWSNTPTAQLIAKFDAERAANLAASGQDAEPGVKAAAAEIKGAGESLSGAHTEITAATNAPKRYITRTLPEWEGTPGIEKFEVRLEDLTRSPFAHTVAQKGSAPAIKKLDVPLIYVEQ